MTELVKQDSPAPDGPGPDFWIRGFLDALRRYRRVTVVGWVVAAAGALALVLRWRSPGLLGLLDFVVSAATLASGVALVHYGIEGLSAFIRTALAATRGLDLAALRAMMAEVEEGGWQDAFAALGRIRRMAEQAREPQV